MNPSELITHDIATLGFSTVAVADPSGTFAYTVGFTELGHPEILISGLRSEICHQFFWDMYNLIKEGKRYAAGETVTELANLPTAFRTLRPSAAREFACQAVFHYEGKDKAPSFLQMVIPDKAGLMPWEDGYDQRAMRCQRHLWVELH